MNNLINESVLNNISENELNEFIQRSGLQGFDCRLINARWNDAFEICDKKGSRHEDRYIVKVVEAKNNATAVNKYIIFKGQEEKNVSQADILYTSDKIDATPFTREQATTLSTALLQNEVMPKAKFGLESAPATSAKVDYCIALEMYYLKALFNNDAKDETGANMLIEKLNACSSIIDHICRSREKPLAGNTFFKMLIACYKVNESFNFNPKRLLIWNNLAAQDSITTASIRIDGNDTIISSVPMILMFNDSTFVNNNEDRAKIGSLIRTYNTVRNGYESWLREKLPDEEPDNVAKNIIFVSDGEESGHAPIYKVLRGDKETKLPFIAFNQDDLIKREVRSLEDVNSILEVGEEVNKEKNTEDSSHEIRFYLFDRNSKENVVSSDNGTTKDGRFSLVFRGLSVNRRTQLGLHYSAASERAAIESKDKVISLNEFIITQLKADKPQADLAKFFKVEDDKVICLVAGKIDMQVFGSIKSGTKYEVDRVTVNATSKTDLETDEPEETPEAEAKPEETKKETSAAPEKASQDDTLSKVMDGFDWGKFIASAAPERRAMAAAYAASLETDEERKAFKSIIQSGVNIKI